MRRREHRNEINRIRDHVNRIFDDFINELENKTKDMELFAGRDQEARWLRFGKKGGILEAAESLRNRLAQEPGHHFAGVVSRLNKLLGEKSIDAR